MSDKPTKNEEVVAKVLADKKAKEEAEAKMAEAGAKALAEAKMAELKAKADAEAERIMRQDADEDDKEDPEMALNTLATAISMDSALTPLERRAGYGNGFSKDPHPGEVAFNRLRTIAMHYPRSTPDEHTIFGFGGERFTLGELRDLTNIR